MGVGIYLQGRYPVAVDSDDPAEDFLIAVQNWFDEDAAADDFWGNFYTRHQLGVTWNEVPALFVMLHPAAEDLEFIVPEAGRVIVSAKTSTVGPGYHIALCQLMHQLGEELQVIWNPEGEEEDSSNDETGYFFTGDSAAVEAEMLLHLQTMARISTETLAETDFTLAAWHLPMDHSFSACPGDIRTPQGVRSAKWVRAVAADPRHGTDIYPWWEEGLTARFYLGRALYGLWTDFRFRPPFTEDEYDDWNLLHIDLCNAYAADPSLDYPWREWLQLVESLNEDGGASGMTDELEALIRQQAARVPETQPLIGYRRWPVKVELADGWSLTIPGEMAELWEENIWSAWDGERTVWFSHWHIHTEEDTIPPAEEVLELMDLPEGEVIEYRNGELVGKAVVGESDEENENGDILINLQAYSAVAGKAALCNVFFPDEGDTTWAIELWQTLTAPPDSEEHHH